MTKQQFIQYCRELEERGYKKTFKYDEKIKNNYAHYLYKVIEYETDEYGDRRAITQLLLYVWNFEDYADRVDENSFYSIEPVVSFSRNTDERIDMHVHAPKHEVEYLEHKAQQFGEWCKQHMDY